ncbi:MAG TPA: MASE1 domain-containing protein [Candidatus Acidoferrum sp.]|nr:MASE1 domain-containing protein [Candidatus Acidoferrum sp.]
MVSSRADLSRLQGFLHLPNSRKELAQFAAVVVGCYLAGQLGLKVTMLHPPVSPVWPPSGVVLAALLLLGYRAWPSVFVGSFLVCLSASTPIHASFAIAAGNTLEALAGAYLVNRFAGGSKVFETAQNVFKFVLFACILSPAISATICFVYLYPAGVPQGPNIPLAWLTWCVGDSIGALLFAPFLVTIFRYAHRLGNREAVELCLLVVGLIATCLTVFGPLSVFVQQKHLLQEWWCLPFLIWAGFRFCQVEVAGTTLLFFGLAIWGTFHGYGPFASPDSNASLMVLAAFVAVTGTTTLAIAATLSERRHVQEGLLGLQSLLEETVQVKTRDLASTIETLQVEVFERMLAEKELRESNDRFQQMAATISDVFWLMDVANMRMLYISPAYETVWGRTCKSIYADPHSWLDAVHPDDHERALTFFDQETKESRYDAEYRIIRPNGDVRHIWDRGYIIRDETGRISRIAGLASDITDKKRLQEELQEAQKRRSERN